MVPDFDIRRDAATGTLPEAGSPVRPAVDKVLEATTGFYDTVEAIKNDARYSPAGQQGKILDEHKVRLEILATGAELAKSDRVEVEEMQEALRGQSHIDEPVESGRANLIIPKFQSSDKSAQLTMIREADNETARALLQAPKILNLLSDLNRQYLVDRLFSQVGDGKRAESLQARRLALSQAEHALAAARRFLDEKAGVKSTLRERLERSRG